MPNHIRNILSVEGDEHQIQEMWEAIKGDELHIDFNAIIPSDENNLDWYNWRIKNWGTKWNSYESGDSGENGIHFDTAWSHPAPIIIKISQMYPELVFSARFADEDFGYNVGEYTIQNGERITASVPEGGTPEAWKLTMDIQNDEEYYLRDKLRDESDYIIEVCEKEINDYNRFFLRESYKRGYADRGLSNGILKLMIQIAVEDKDDENIKKLKEILG